MKQTIHVHLKNADGEPECYVTEGNFFLAIKALYAIWRYGEGEVQIGEEDGQSTTDSEDSN